MHGMHLSTSVDIHSHFLLLVFIITVLRNVRYIRYTFSDKIHAHGKYMMFQLFCVLLTALTEDTKSAKVRKQLINNLGVFFLSSFSKMLSFKLINV